MHLRHTLNIVVIFNIITVIFSLMFCFFSLSRTNECKIGDSSRLSLRSHILKSITQLLSASHLVTQMSFYLCYSLNAKTDKK